MKKIAIIGLSGNSIFYEVDKLPVVGETIIANNLHIEVGGKGFNQAIACKRQGLNVYYLSAIGNDSVGKECIAYMKKENIECMFKIKNIATATASILRDNESNNEVIEYAGANDYLDIDDLYSFEKYIKDSDCILLQYEIPYKVLKESIEIARKHKKMIVLNPAPFIYDDLDLLKKADIITPNEVEVVSMFKLEKFDKQLILNKIKEYELQNVIITLGNNGCLVYNNLNHDFIHIPSIKVNAMDSTGAGDVFNASLCVKLLDGKNIVEACEYANKVAALSVTKKYVLDSIPSLKDIYK